MLEIGRITRPHGVRGEVNVLLTSNRTERVEPGSVLSCSKGPLEIISSRPHKSGWIVRFRGVDDREGADELRNLVLSAPPIEDPDELWVHHLIGAMVIDQTGTERGRVVLVVENPVSDLLELDSGALVPLRFVASHVPGETIHVDVPDGLFELGNS